MCRNKGLLVELHINNNSTLVEQEEFKLEYFRSHKSFRKEARIKEIIEERVDHPCHVHIFSAIEGCSAYRPWYNKKTHQAFLKPTTGKYLHSHSLIDWRQLNCTVTLINGLMSTVPLRHSFAITTTGSFMQVEYATDLIFHRQSEFQPLYEIIVRFAAVDVNPDQVATFIGRKLFVQYRDEVGNNINTRIMGTRIRHTTGQNSIILYDKGGLIACVKCTNNKVASLKQRREVEQRNGEVIMHNAPLRKTIYSLETLCKLMGAANQRYLAYMTSIEHPGSGQKACNRFSSRAKVKSHSNRGFTLILQEDFNVFITLIRGEWAIPGFRAGDLRRHISQLTQPRCSYLIKRLRTHCIIKMAGHCYK